MKKNLPLLLFVFGLIIFIVIFFVVRRNSDSNDLTDETVKEVELSKRPFVSLIPTSDGHWLKLRIQKLMIEKAVTLDYELLYTLPDGRVQGVPGTVKLEGLSEIERDLLLGSESSGKFRYDEGVKEGSLSVRFRDGKGKLLAKFTGKFHMQSGDLNLTSVDGNFEYVLEKPVKGEFFVTMETFGFPSSAPEVVTMGPYGIFGSLESLPTGEASGWQKTSEGVFFK